MTLGPHLDGQAAVNFIASTTPAVAASIMRIAFAKVE
jgi:hypothetical protein